MKNLFAGVFLIIVVTAKATTRTVSNNPATIAQFSTIQAAVDASVSGDTILIHGSPNQYASFTITNKRLVIIGPGWAPNKQLSLTAMVNGFNIDGVASTRSEIHGLNINSGNISISTNHPDSIRFIRNRFTGGIDVAQASTTYRGYVFEGNVFYLHAGITANTNSSYHDFLFRNNYFYDWFSTGNISGFTNSFNVWFDHNLWFGPSSGSIDCFSGNNSFLTLTNNIFVRRNAATSNSFSTFNNNITFGAGVNNPWAVNNNIDAGGNVENQDPQMVDQVSVNAGVDNPLLNYTIASGPANNSGSDGKDMGLLFDLAGSLNWANSRNSRVPLIFSMNITNPTIAAGGNLNIQVEARKSN